MKPLRDLLAGVRVVAIHGHPGVVVSAIALDSRRVSPGACFVAVPGTRTDGSAFARDAVDRGAVAVVSGRPADPALLGRAVWVQVDEPRRAAALLAAAHHGRPADRLVLLGVTGTNGKTTTTYLLEAALAASGLAAGLVGTIETRFAGRSEPAGLTTPDAVTLHALLAGMVEAGTTHVAMEVSSHALALDRVAGIRFQGAAFTNLSQDHLDFHGTFEAYAEAKLRLFREHIGPGAHAVVSASDPAGERFAATARAAGARVVRFSAERGAEADLAVAEARCAATGTAAMLDLFGERVDVETSLVGRHNLENLLAAIGLAVAAGVEPSDAARGACRLAAVPGRLERIPLPSGAAAFVDYCHTPDALDRAITTLRELCAGRLWVVFGCGGDRDRGKRPIMGRLAARADRAIVTSDNPRSEPPEAIIEEIERGLIEAGMPRTTPAALPDAGRAWAREPDRAAAIAAAVRGAARDDFVLVAGKGHETYQIVGDARRGFDDGEEVRKAAGIDS